MIVFGCSVDSMTVYVDWVRSGGGWVGKRDVSSQNACDSDFFLMDARTNYLTNHFIN